MKHFGFLLEPSRATLHRFKVFDFSTLRKHARAIYTAIFHGCNNDNFQMKNCNIFQIFAQNIDRGYTLEPLSEAVLTSTHNLCFRAKIRK